MIRRAPREQNFTVLPNAALDDERLSYRARGVLAHVLSKPDHWRTNARQLAARGKEGRDAIRAALNELQEAGYATLSKGRKEDGSFVSEWLISDEPGGLSVTGAWKTGSGSPGPGKSGPLVSTDEQELNRTTGASTVNQPTTGDQLVYLRAVKDQLRHVGEG